MPKVTWMTGADLKVDSATERRGPLNGRKPKLVKVRGGIGSGGKKLNYLKKRAVKDTATSQSPCKVCGEPLRFDIDKWTTRLVRLELDGTFHRHQDG
jgi:hypothetical protein